MADFDALRAVREDVIPPVRDHDPTLPAELDAILLEALARDPRKRLPSAGELGKRLRGLRYSLDTSSGDPAAALARLVPTVTVPAAASAPVAEPDPRHAPKGKPGRRTKPSTGGFEVTTEPTFVRIRTADGFAQNDPDGSGLLNARKLLDRFEEEETRLARLPRDLLDDDATDDRERARRGSGEVTVAAPPLHLDSDPTGERPPLHLEDSDHGPRDRRPAGKSSKGKAPEPVKARASGSPAPESVKGRVPASPPPPPAMPKAAAAAKPAASAPAPAGTPVGERRDASSVKPGASAPVFGGTAAGSHPPIAARRDPSGARATPTSPQVFDMPGVRPSSAPPVAGFSGGSRRWWPILVGAAIIAVLSFLITSAALEAPERSPAPAAATDAATDAAATPDAGVDAQ
jgi:hypothetical protein